MTRPWSRSGTTACRNEAVTTPPRRASRRLTSDHARELEVLRRLETAAVTRRLGLEQPAELES